MSDEPAPPKPAEPAKGPGPSKAMLGLLILNLAGTGFVAFRLLTAGPAAAATPAHAAEGSGSSSAEITGPVVELDPFVVNLDEPGTSRYLKLTLEVEVMPNGAEALAKSKQAVRDAILSYLSGLHVKDTLGAEAKDKIRQDLMAKLTKLLGANRVRRMFFRDFVVQ